MDSGILWHLIAMLVPFLSLVVLPILIFIVIPGIAAQHILKQRFAYSIGAFIGIIGLFTFGPFAN